MVDTASKLRKESLAGETTSCGTND